MPYQKIKYCCSICNWEYETEPFAKQCEERGLPEGTKDIKVDDKIKFFRKLMEHGTIESWKEMTGIVRDKVTMFDQKAIKHIDMIIAEIEEENEKGEKEKCEVLVGYYDISQEGYKLMSPTGVKYKVGFGEAQRKARGAK